MKFSIQPEYETSNVIFKDVTNIMDLSVREDSDADTSVGVVERRL